MFRPLPDCDNHSVSPLEQPLSHRSKCKLRRNLLGKHFVALVITVGEVEVFQGSAVAFTAGETLTAGMPVYQSITDNRVYKADANTGDSRKAVPVGITLHAALAGQPIVVQNSGIIDIGATMILGENYYVGNTAGEIVPYADLSSSFVTLIGIATDTTNKYLTFPRGGFFASGVIKT